MDVNASFWQKQEESLWVFALPCAASAIEIAQQQGFASVSSVT